MNEGNKKSLECLSDPQPSEDSQELNEEDLEQAVGGFQIFDTCRGYFSEPTCMIALWGRCSELVETKPMTYEDQNGERYRKYHLACKQGKFSPLIFKTNF